MPIDSGGEMVTLSRCDDEVDVSIQDPFALEAAGVVGV
jgi:hypothetical protein